MGWLSGWAKRIELTIPDTNVEANLTNFPVLVYLSAASGVGDVDVSCVFDELASDANRKKIAVTTSDGETQCYVEIERWDDANEKAWLWVKVPSILTSGGATIYLYYDSTQDDNTTYIGDTTDAAGQSVWDANFVGVWHLAQDPNGDASGAIKDSTSNANHGTPSGSMTTEDLVDGPIGKAIDFDGTDDYINFGSGATLDDIAQKTVEATINFDDFGEADSGRIVQKANVNADGWQFLIQGGVGMNRLYYGQDWNGGTFAHWWTDADTLAASTQYVVAVTYDKGSTDNNPLMYIDGVSKSVTENVSPVGTADSDSANSLWAGARNNSGTDREYDGKIDEIRISNILRSSAWIKATYYSNTDAIVTFGEEETAEQTFIEDASLDLSVYGRQLEDFQSFLRAHDGLELHDLETVLEVFGLSMNNFPASLIAVLQTTEDFATAFETWATQYKDLAGVFEAKGQSIESLMSRLEAANAKYKDLAAYLSVTDGSVLKDLALFLSATDGSTLKNLGLYLKAIRSVPAFRSITAQRVSSVVHEVS